jgi:hypothetical protein
MLSRQWMEHPLKEPLGGEPTDLASAPLQKQTP